MFLAGGDDLPVDERAPHAVHEVMGGDVARRLHDDLVQVLTDDRDLGERADRTATVAGEMARPTTP